MIKGIILTLVVLLILHYYGIDVNHIITQVGGLIVSAWHWLVHLVTGA